MIKFILSLFVCSIALLVNAQPVPEKLNKAWQNFMADDQLQYSTSGICVMDAQTGKIIFGRNENIGMAPASTQKIFTTVAAFEALGKDYRYQTNIGYTGSSIDGVITGDIIVEGSGDPTLGSWRYAQTKDSIQLKQIVNVLKTRGINAIVGNLIAKNKGFDINPLPQDWMWGDIGNYYGAGHWALNWNENQYDLHFKTGNIEGNKTDFIGGLPQGIDSANFINNVTTGRKNSGDNSIIYAAPYSSLGFINGTLEPNQKNFVVSGSSPNGEISAMIALQNIISKKYHDLVGSPITSLEEKIFFKDSGLDSHLKITPLTTIQSPSLDSIVYWFLKKSINLYGEGLLRTIGLEKEGFGSTEKGLQWVDSFYTANKIDIRSRHMRDGSGLSPTNRVTPTALVLALQLAKTKSWFPYFYDALPFYNGMKLKSGTIHRTKSFAGYHTAKDGKQYIVSLMVNNYNGSTGSLVEKMFAVLDVLK